LKTRLRILFSFLLAIALNAFSQQEQQQEFSLLLATAKRAQSDRKFAAAAEAYKKAVQLRSDQPMLWTNLGLMQEATGDDSGAIESLRKADLLDPSLYVANLFLGIAYTHINRPREAIPFLIKAESLNHHDALAPLSLGHAYVADKNLAAAESAFRRTLTIDNRNSSAWFALGLTAINVVEIQGWKLSDEAAESPWAKSLFAEALQKQSRIQEAISQEKAVLAADPHFPCAYAQLGYSYLAQQQNAAALKAFTDESPDCSLASLGRARLYLQTGDATAALALLAKVWVRDAGFLSSYAILLTQGLAADRTSAFSVALNQRRATGELDASLYAVLAATLPGEAPVVGFTLSMGASSSPMQRSGHPTGAGVQSAESDATDGRYGRCTADFAHDMDRYRDSELLLLARCAFMTGDYDRSVLASDLVLKRVPKDLEALYWSVKANEGLASVALGRFEELKPNSERTHLLLGDMYRQSQRYQQAVFEYKAAAALAPRDPAPLFGLASVYSEDSNIDEALATAKAALGMNSNDPELNFLVGQIFVTQHRWTEAEDYLKRATGAKSQMLPHLHFLLGQIYGNTDRTKDAIRELRLALSGDEDGSAYYQLAQLYKSLGNMAAARDALNHVKEIKEKRHERALIVVQDLGDATQNDTQ
jgi:tetratricopeptide (TPR) repeat protein